MGGGGSPLLGGRGRGCPSPASYTFIYRYIWVWAFNSKRSYGNAAKLNQILTKYDSIFTKATTNVRMHVDNFQEGYFLGKTKPCGLPHNLAKGL